MFCPNCSAFLLESDFVHVNARYAPGDVPVEYDVRCPECRVIIGKMFWGRLTLDPDMVKPGEAVGPVHGPKNPAKVCPHCGMPLPEDY